MEILNGLYRLKKPHQVEEKHGGGILKHEVFWYLAFYNDSDLIGLYGSGPNDFRRFLSKDFDLKGKIIEQNENQFAFFIHNPYSNEKIIFEGAIIENGRKLKLKAYNENTPQEIWIDDTFEYINVL